MYIQTIDRGLLKAKFINVLNPGASHDFVVAWESGNFEYMRKSEILSICDDSSITQQEINA
jgi:hypothetical protein